MHMRVLFAPLIHVRCKTSIQENKLQAYDDNPIILCGRSKRYIPKLFSTSSIIGPVHRTTCK